MKVLIFGASGSGKTYCVETLAKEGHSVFDADTVNGLHGWYNAEGKKVNFPQNPTMDFFNNHNFRWNREFLKDFLSTKTNVFLFGLSGNIFEMLDLFDDVYFLNVPNNILEDRLQHESRENPTGNTLEQRKMIINYAKKMKNKCKKYPKIKFIDGTLSPQEIFRVISTTN